MTPKERIRRAIMRLPTDRVPTTMECVDTTWEKLMKHFRVESQFQIEEMLDVDTRIMELPPYIGPDRPSYPNEKGEMVHTHPLGYQYIDKWNGVEFNWHVVGFPLEHIETWEQFEAYDGWTDPDWFDYSYVADFCDRFPDHAIRIGWPGPYQVFTMLYPQDKFYIMMMEEPELTKALLNKYCDISLEIYERMFQASGDRIDILRVCDDYGTQRGPLFSPGMWDEFFAYNTKRFVDLAHKHNAFYQQHSCGAIRDIIPNLIACGVDLLEPLQKVVGMEPAGLKRDFGDKIAFMGGVDTQKLLPFGTPEEVRAEAEHFIRTLGEGGGYILMASQEFEGDVPIENILAVYEARKAFQ